MNAIDKIEKNAHKFKLTTNRINATMIKVYSSKFMFDSWIVEQQGFKLKLLHMSKKGIGTKCSYHLQRQVNIKNWKWVLETIVSHNKFVMTQKWNVRENLVDKKEFFGTNVTCLSALAMFGIKPIDTKQFITKFESKNSKEKRQ